MPTFMPKFLLYSCLCCAHGCVYTCTVHTDCDCTVVFPLWPIGASHTSRGHHTHRVKYWARVPRLKKSKMDKKIYHLKKSKQQTHKIECYLSKINDNITINDIKITCDTLNLDIIFPPPHTIFLLQRFLFSARECSNKNLLSNSWWECTKI